MVKSALSSLVTTVDAVPPPFDEQSNVCVSGTEQNYDGT